MKTSPRGLVAAGFVGAGFLLLFSAVSGVTAGGPLNFDWLGLALACFALGVVFWPRSAGGSRSELDLPAAGGAPEPRAVERHASPQPLAMKKPLGALAGALTGCLYVVLGTLVAIMLVEWMISR